MGRPNTALVISETERRELEAIVRSRSLPHAVVRRAQIILRSADGESNRTVARACGVSAPVISLWRTRYQRNGLAGLHSELRPGRPRKHSDDQVAALLQTVLQSKPEVVTHWTVRSAAAKTGISKSSVARYFALFGVQPHRSKSFKLSTDPFLCGKSPRDCRSLPQSTGQGIGLVRR
jgi:transposase